MISGKTALWRWSICFTVSKLPNADPSVDVLMLGRVRMQNVMLPPGGHTRCLHWESEINGKHKSRCNFTLRIQRIMSLCISKWGALCKVSNRARILGVLLGASPGPAIQEPQFKLQAWDFLLCEKINTKLTGNFQGEVEGNFNVITTAL